MDLVSEQAPAQVSMLQPDRALSSSAYKSNKCRVLGLLFLSGFTLDAALFIFLL